MSPWNKDQMAQNICKSLFLYSYMPIMFYSRILWMICNICGPIVKMNNTVTQKGEPIQVAQSFKYIGINVPLTNRWNVCCESRHQAGLAHGMKQRNPNFVLTYTIRSTILNILSSHAIRNRCSSPKKDRRSSCKS